MSHLFNELRFYGYQWQQNLKNQQAMRINFLTQLIGMVLSNTSFFIIWIMFSKAVGVVNGWGAVQTFGMMSVSMMTFGVVHTLFGSTGSVTDLVPTGEFDALLTKPKNLYVRIINRDMSPSAAGDLIQGIVGAIIFLFMIKADLASILLFLIMLPPAVMAQLSFIMICDCLIFWLPQTPMIGNTLRDLIILPTTQPISMLRGFMRVVYLTAIPALLVAGTPVEMVTYYKYELIAVAYAVGLVWLSLSVWVLKTAVRRYESGNVIG